MNFIRTSRNITFIALILSLLFHISTIFYIFLQKTHNPLFSATEQNNTNKTLQQQQQQEKDNAWVETQARAGNFGAPVFFEDVSSDVKEEALVKEDKQEDEQPQLEQNITNVQKNSPEIETPQEKKDTAQTTPTLDVSDKSLEKNNVLLNTITQPQPKIESQKLTAKKRTPQKKTQQNNYITTQNTPKPPITLAQLTQGFLNQRKEQSGSYGISMLGMNRGIPSGEQMKYERYLQKLSWCIQNSFRINERQHPPMSQATTVHVFFALNRDGTLKQLSLKKSSGNMYIDQFVLFIFRDASSSFPPVPSYLTDDPFSITCIVS